MAFKFGLIGIVTAGLIVRVITSLIMPIKECMGLPMTAVLDIGGSIIETGTGQMLG